ncbi:MAG: acyl carrier protein [Planctomycetota bacterium]
MPTTMTPDEVVRTVCRLAAEQGGVPLTDVALETEFERDLNYDSLAKVEFAMELESAFDLSIPDEQADGVRSVRDVVALIHALRP